MASLPLPKPHYIHLILLHAALDDKPFTKRRVVEVPGLLHLEVDMDAHMQVHMNDALLQHGHTNAAYMLRANATRHVHVFACAVRAVSVHYAADMTCM